MPISDLLWGCPACGEDRTLENDPPVCRACGTRFLHGPRATIRAVAPDGSETARSAADWVERLPHPASLLHNRPVRTARVTIRTATTEEKVFGIGGYLNRVEVFGEETAGTLRLESDHLVVTREAGEGRPGKGPDAEAEAVEEEFEEEFEEAVEEEVEEAVEVWPLETLTAVQTSSRSLQLKRRDSPLVAFRFHDDAVFLWERLLRAALRDFYGRTGRGEILEFQPRIETR